MNAGRARALLIRRGALVFILGIKITKNEYREAWPEK